MSRSRHQKDWNKLIGRINALEAQQIKIPATKITAINDRLSSLEANEGYVFSTLQEIEDKIYDIEENHAGTGIDKS